MAANFSPGDVSKAICQNVNELQALYHPLVGSFNEQYAPHESQINKALQIANLQKGESVVDLGCGGGQLLAGAMEQVGSQGTVIGVDGVAGLLQRDCRATLQARGIPIASAGSPGTGVHLVHADITRTDIANYVFATTRLSPRQFDCIFLLDVLPHIPSRRRAPLLRTLRQMLRPGGRLITTFLLRVPDPNHQATADANLPMQFKHTSRYTEAPACLTLQDPTTHQVTHAELLASRRLYNLASTQAADAAAHVNMTVRQTHRLGSSAFFPGLAVTSQSPAPAELNSMSFAQLGAWYPTQAVRQGKWDHVAVQKRFLELYHEDWSSWSQAEQDLTAARQLQQHIRLMCPRLPPGSVHSFINVGVLVELT